jgi:hypothetical protein
MKELPLSPFWPFWPIGKSITYAESMRTWGSNPPPATNSKLFPFNGFQSGDKKLNERLALDSLSLSQTLSGLIWQSKGRK